MTTPPSVNQLFVVAIRLGLSPTAFWDLTPAETIAFISGRIEAESMRQRSLVQAAWLVAKLSRVKRIPSLTALLSHKPARKLTGGELQARRAEFAELTERFDVGKWVPRLGREKDE